MRRVRLLADVRRELLHETAYYEQAREGTGRRFRQAAEAAFVRALAFPMSGTPAPSGTRRTAVQGFPFSVVYREVDDGILVYAIAHERRRPAYWEERADGDV